MDKNKYTLTRYKSRYFNCKFFSVVWQAGKTSSGAWLLHLIEDKTEKKTDMEMSMTAKLKGRLFLICTITIDCTSLFDMIPHTHKNGNKI